MSNLDKNDKYFKTILTYSKAPFNYYLILSLSTIYLSLFNVIFSIFIQEGLNKAVTDFSFQTLIIFIFQFVFACLAYSFSLYISGVYKEKIIQNIDGNLKRKVLLTVLRMPLAKAQKFSTGDIITRLFDDCSTVSNYICKSIFPFIQLLLTIIFGIGYVLSKSWQMAVITILTLPIFYFVNKKIASKLMKNQSEYQKIEGDYKTFIEEYHTNIPVIQIFKMYKQLNQRHQKMLSDKLDQAKKMGSIFGYMISFTEAAVLIVELLLLFIGIVIFRFGNLTLGGLIGSWNAAVGSIIYPTTELPNIISNLSLQRVSLQRVMELINSELSEDSERSVPVSLTKQASLVLNDAAFSYNSGSFGLEQLNFKCQIGDIVYIVGESGQGKTTLLRLLLQFYPLKKGSLYIEDSNLPHNSIQNVADYLSYVPQGRSVIELSILENLRIGYPEASMEELFHACKLCEIHDFIMSLPHQYETVIGVETDISEGQAQRIAIARAILKNTPFIVFDEPFASLDEINRQSIMKLMQSLSQTKGIIVVSHDLSSLKIATKMYKMKRGELIEEEKK